MPTWSQTGLKANFYLFLSSLNSDFPTPVSYYSSQKSGFISTRFEEEGNVQICTDLIIIIYFNLATIQIRKSSQVTGVKTSYWISDCTIMENQVGISR